jgi:hypothetical protein
MFLQEVFEDAGGMSLASPLKVVVQPLADGVAGLIPHTIPLALLALALLLFALRQMMKVMKGAVLSRLEKLFDRVLFRNDAASFTLGMVATASVQSSSATTSLVIPLAGTGVLSLRQIYPYTLGANLGTTITAILASFSTGSSAAVTVALAHLAFNVMGIAIFYPLGAVPIWLASEGGQAGLQVQEDVGRGGAAVCRGDCPAPPLHLQGIAGGQREVAGEGAPPGPLTVLLLGLLQGPRTGLPAGLSIHPHPHGRGAGLHLRGSATPPEFPDAASPAMTR